MKNYDMLNPMQKEAVLHTKGPLLVLAGAGSGKTRVLTHRISYLIDECGVNPWNILAITFTNKAAAEMRERVDRLVDYGADSVWVSTFHSLCVRILRRFIDRLGYDTDFTIYDTDDQKTLMRQIIKDYKADTAQYKERNVLSEISTAKNELITPENFLNEARKDGDYRKQKIAEFYIEYQKRMKTNNALDFDDLLMKTVELFRKDAEVLSYYQEKFRYIMVDEYQDTNTAQFQLVKLLAEKYSNICVVGDDDQSIYAFRGANIRNILSFEETFPGAKVVKLEQNYRSSQKILDAANGVIKNNKGRKDKKLWTENDAGEDIRFQYYETQYEEADGIVGDILKKGGDWKDFAILYRTNAQSRVLEEKFVSSGIPYRLVGGVNFYQRKEIKDILAYLKTIESGRDAVAVQRIINVPKRGIGDTTVGKIQAYALASDLVFYDALLKAHEIPEVKRAASKIDKFTEQIGHFREMMDDGAEIKDVFEAILEETGYREALKAEGEVEAETRLANIEELMNKAVSYWQSAETPTLTGFLEDVALVAEIDNLDDSDNKVILMTLHSAKGLEFPNVYLCGMEDGLFPSMMAISDDPEAVDEERRLCYVGITRAQKTLTLTAARQRMQNGRTMRQMLSRFLTEIPETLLEMDSQSRAAFERAKNRGNDDFDDHELPWGSSYESHSYEEHSFGHSDSYSGSGRRSYEDGGLGKSYGSVAYFENFAKNGFGSPVKEKKPSFGKAFTVKKSSSLEYEVGDTVHHLKFGDGTVTNIEDGGKDFEVTVDFGAKGVRKMFASFAKLTKV